MSDISLLSTNLWHELLANENPQLYHAGLNFQLLRLRVNVSKCGLFFWYLQISAMKVKLIFWMAEKMNLNKKNSCKYLCSVIEYNGKIGEEITELGKTEKSVKGVEQKMRHIEKTGNLIQLMTQQHRDSFFFRVNVSSSTYTQNNSYE